MTVSVDFGHLGEVVFVIYKVTLLFILYFLGGSHYVQPRLKEGEYLHKLFLILLYRRFVCSPPFICSVVYISVYSGVFGLIFWVIIQSYFILLF